MKSRLTLLFAVLALTVNVIRAGSPLEIFPWPQEIKQGTGYTALTGNGQSKIVIQADVPLTSRHQAILKKIGTKIAELCDVKINADTALEGSGTVKLILKQAVPDDNTVPDKAEAYTLTAGGGEIRIVGRDAAGLKYGMLAMLQLLRKADGETVVPAVEISDYPDIRWRTQPIGKVSDDYLEFITETGRSNGCFMDLLVMNWSTRIPFEDNADDYRKRVARLHEYGMIVVCSSGGFYSMVGKVKNREFCPLEDTPEMLKMFKKAIAAGVDGLAWHFDDLNSMPPMVTHYKTCKQCSTRFKSMGQSQAYCLEQMVKLGDEHKLKFFWACPTLYTHHCGYLESYARIDPTLNEPAYFHDFCNFNGADKVQFYYCDYGKPVYDRITKDGLRNFIWWNNGPWSAGGPEIWGSYIAFPRLAYSWDFIDIQAIEKDRVEKFDQARYADLANARKYTSLIYSGTGDPVAIGLANFHAWNNQKFVADEDSARKFMLNQLFGPNGYANAMIWEKYAKPLWIKYLKLIFFNDADRQDLQTMDKAFTCLKADVTNLKLTERILPHMQTVRNILSEYANLIQPLNDGKYYAAPASFGRANDALFIMAPSADAPAINNSLSPKLSGPSLCQSVVNDRVGIVMNNDKLQLQDNSFVLSRQPFSIELIFAPMQLGHNQYSQFIGTRNTYREIYPGLPGWACGLDGQTQKVRFTVEDPARQISTVTMKNNLKLNHFTHIVIVRDWANKKLLLYVNGKLENSVNETGSGDFPNKNMLQIGYDNYGGAYYIGAIYRMFLYNHAITAGEVEKKYQQALSK